MNAKQKIHQAKLNQWIDLFKEQADNGLTVRQWCEENNYSIHTYNYWKVSAWFDVYDDKDREFIKDLLPWSEAVQEKCRSLKKS